MKVMQAVLAAIMAAALSAPALAQQGKAPPLALKGHDPVAYFNPGESTKGSDKITFDFDDARYRFASTKNRDLFAANPDRYSPQFTGLCTTGLAMGMKADANPDVFLVKDGKLYVFS